MDQLWLFATLTLFVSASPGPVMLSCMADAARFGVRHSLFTMLGASGGNLFLMVLSALGLSLLVTQETWLFNTIKWIGALYLIYVGFTLCRAAPSPITLVQQQVRRDRLFGKAFVIAVTNPKGLVYFGALFPQFIDMEKSIVSQCAVLSAIFLAMDLVWMLAYAFGGRILMRWMKAPEHQRWFNRVCGGALMVMGALLALSKI